MPSEQKLKEPEPQAKGQGTGDAHGPTQIALSPEKNKSPSNELKSTKILKKRSTLIRDASSKYTEFGNFLVCVLGKCVKKDINDIRR